MTVLRLFYKTVVFLNYNTKIVERNGNPRAIQRVMSVLESSPASGTLTQVFEEVAACQPRAVLMSYEERQWTYEEIDRWSNAIAAQLCDSLEPAGSGVIGVTSNNPTWLLASYLGVLKSGHAYAGLDPSFPDERLATMCRVASVSACLTDEDQYSRVRDGLNLGIPTIVACQADGSTARAKAREAPRADDLSHVLFTSGSTGVPKAVPRKHGHILHNTWRHRRLRISPSDKVTLITRNGFWDAVSNPYNALLNGATLCVTRVMGGDRFALAEWIERERATVYYSLTTIFRQLLTTRRPEDKLQSLRLVYLGGERVDSSDVQKCKAVLSERAEVAIGLASTETGITALKVCPVGELESDAQPTVGKPVDGISIEVRTESGDLAHAHERGEIVFLSEYLFSGYLHAPTNGAKPRIYPDRTIPGRYVYESGDIGFFDQHGELTVVGRVDQQIKIRGFRVELGEIESALRSAASVADVAVVFNSGAGASGEGDGAIVAFLVGRETNVDIQELRTRLSAILPEHMLPARMWLVERIPRLPNGKIDRVGLVTQDTEKQRERAALETHVAPVGDLEMTVAKMWSELLEVPSFSRTDRFFEAGGNSLKALMFIFRLTEHLGKELPYSLILAGDELAGFCARTAEFVAKG
jgi:acyl-coenzyme A synthetase/AMP-(fatty) acid ligase